MKLIKRLLLVVLVLVGLLLVISLFLPAKVHVERELAIRSSPERIFEQINTLTNWEKWSPWHKRDPNMTLQYSGPAAGPGAKYSWQSKQRNVGNGTLTITESVPPQRVTTAMHFDDGDATGLFQLLSEEGHTTVVWGMDSNMGRNPIGRFFGLMMDKMVGPDFEQGLANLKALCEGK